MVAKRKRLYSEDGIHKSENLKRENIVIPSEDDENQMKYFDGLFSVIRDNRQNLKKSVRPPDHVSFEVAMLLREKGFDWPCDSYYNRLCATDDEYWLTTRGQLFNWNGLRSECQISAPSLWWATRWLWEKHNFHIQINSVIGHRWSYDLVDTRMAQYMTGEYISRVPEREGYPVFDTYEDALEAGIKEVLISVFLRKEV